ncbi:oxygen-independent coproporphyrinogen-3 oxidase [Herbaspirillum sp. Sphag1AN]|uniref:radical SAM family heme chaperone HemW n=1 Tax=unclassified Herbaspirillum TaxID=2624150 RepID=UPI0016214F53|nr:MULTISPECIES: radical SAM family heme chaperone HemW [unclassified Herbaspirillum]MBB3212168.1 oxygen-independent coproporphyrinogen-3 oxidase [Herbaspirillum sp. Sphag1AN]MBB3243998.1 oxygen-independent coproporphyrinogen-3 oxidase [Herbaspirillum sp. Sphag64]
MIPIKPIPVDSPDSGAAGPSSQSGPQQAAQAALNFLKPGSLQLTALPPLALYVHFPWCVKKCPYCDFNSHEVKDSFPEEAYLNALRSDLESALPLIWGRKVYSIFIGGGTPSLLSAAGLDRLLSDIRTLLPLDLDIEVTMEANPGTFEADKFKSYRASGINRLSIGIQSFDSGHLAALGRIHDGDQARRAIEIAQDNFDNFNLDLMYALPSQTLAQARRDIETAIAYAPPHLSLYHLTLEPNTLFAKYPPPVPDDDTSADMQDMIAELTGAAGYGHYEVSAYAKAQRQARHNLNYWQFGDYLGIGAGAHSKLSFPHRIVRQMRYKHPTTYLEKSGQNIAVQEESEITREALGFEFMLNALRLTEGFPVNLFAERTGMGLNTIEAALNEAEVKGLLHRDHRQIRPSELGRRFLNDLQEMFLK